MKSDESAKPEAHKSGLSQTQNEHIETPLVESKKQHALTLFATILAITGVGFALWFNFSDQGQHIIR